MSAPTHALVADDLPSSRDWLAQALGLAFPGIAVAGRAVWPRRMPR